jgi:holliday junction DNA helicase RuvA
MAMIATLRGMVDEKTADMVVLDVNGVGYGLLMTNEDYGRLAPGEKAKVYVYEHIREAAYDLFGFIHADTKRLFVQLLDVNGVGPKMALNVLNIGVAHDVRSYIAAGDVKSIQKANGVGKRVAERIVVELKDKVGLEGVDLSVTGLLQPSVAVQKDDATDALVALGYTPQDAAAALQGVPADLPTEERIKRALRQA